MCRVIVSLSLRFLTAVKVTNHLSEQTRVRVKTQLHASHLFLNMCIITSYFIFIAFSVLLLYHFNFYVFLQSGSLLYTHFFIFFSISCYFFLCPIFLPIYLTVCGCCRAWNVCKIASLMENSFCSFNWSKTTVRLWSNLQAPPPPHHCGLFEKFCAS